VLAVVAILVFVGIVGSFLYARSIFNRIDRVPVSSELSSASHGTNYLIVGSDTRADVKPGQPGYAGAGVVTGARSDTLMVLNINGGKVKMLSIPRDLYVEIAGTGNHQKINAAYNGGPKRLVATITQDLGIPINRYMEVDFVSFAGLVDALGGVTINFPHPAIDTNSGLNITQAGPNKLNGAQALAFVRSRHYTEIINGRQVQDPRADLGRIQRQQEFLRVVFAKLSKTKNPFRLAHVANGMAGGLHIDDKMSLFDALRLGWAMRGINPQSLVLPTTPARRNGADVLLLQQDAAKPIIDQVR